ncbi:hypothetical protein [Nostoc sp. FACHB-133]|uniref:hypothetical protein n=1 Tax=Nostoc sp. FACHB-133 TaxID=2692835 RepID=UPI00168950E1|nr:hypothetical protein [Nostoc sp. FACHB-133]MBD2521409.1 hypothetical protein [Nostoc sp. FACHB-133]
MTFKSTKFKSKILIVLSLIFILFISVILANNHALVVYVPEKLNTNLFLTHTFYNETRHNMVSADFGEQFQLKISEIASINSGKVELTLLDVTEDSRCPSDLNCFWAGQIQIIVKILVDKKDLGKSNLIYNASRKDLAIKKIDNYLIEFIKAEPYPKSNQKIELSDYVFTLVVSLLKDN